MSDPKLEFPEVVGKFVAELSVYEDAEFGKEVLVRFTDGTQLSIAVGVRQGSRRSLLQRGNAGSADISQASKLIWIYLFDRTARVILLRLPY
jgi:hypothetical protein